jgi:DNA modification methylase
MLDLFAEHCVTGRGWVIYLGDVLHSLKSMPTGCLHMVVTSPPYFGHRRYLEGDDAEIGIEPTVAEYVAALVAVFEELKRVLRLDGTVWLNLGDSYSDGSRDRQANRRDGADATGEPRAVPISLGEKQRLGVPYQVVFALQAAGWVWRDEIVWHKLTPMPDPATDRTTKAHESVFVLSQRPHYFYDADGFKQPKRRKAEHADDDIDDDEDTSSNLRSVWTLPTEPLNLKLCQTCKAIYTKPRYRELQIVRLDDGGMRKATRRCACGAVDWLSHFAAFPSELPSRCIKLGTSARGVCPACLAPWERVTEKSAIVRDRPNEYTARAGEAGTGNHCANTVAGTRTKTTGWRPTCECDAGETIPATVGDLFTGSGTSAMVATELGRDFIGFELNPDYAILASYRANSWRTRTTEPPLVPIIGQESLFA